MSTDLFSSEESPADFAAVLQRSYGLDPTALHRLCQGQGTRNYRLRTADGRRYFVKHYLPETDVTAEIAAIEQTWLAGQCGVPVATPHPAATGEAIVGDASGPVSLWDWVDGQVPSGGLTSGQQRAAGGALGWIHRAFAEQEASRAPSRELGRWHTKHPAALQRRVDELLDCVAARSPPDEFDALAEQTLHERRLMLDRVDALRAALPTLSTQVLHADFSAVNLLFCGDELVAVTDFRPPNPFLVSYELGRIAFDPRSLAYPGWLERARTLIAAYRTARPEVGEGDVVYSARIALIQLTTSLYGVSQHYLAPGLLQDDLDTFWLQRHHAARELFAHLDTVERALTTLVAPAGGSLE